LEARWFGYQGYTGLLGEINPLDIPAQLGINGDQIAVPATQGCQGPYAYGVQGTGGFGAGCCPCPCCPPPCCSSVTVDFTCGSQGVQGCTDPITKETSYADFILKEDGTTIVGQEAAVSISVMTLGIVPASYQQGGSSDTGTQGGQGPQASGICCIEYLGGSFRAVGNGYVNYTGTLPPPTGSCTVFTVKINGQIPPVYVTDGTSLTITVESADPVCCPCAQTGTSNPCGLTMRMAAMMRNDKIVLDRKAVVQKVAAVRKQKLQQKMRMLKSSPS